MDTNNLHPETARRAAIVAGADPAAGTPGRLLIVENGQANHYAALDDRGGWLFALLHNGEAMPARQLANMRRLVACWNACEGLDTRTLEALAGGTLAEELGRLSGNRGEPLNERERASIAAALEIMNGLRGDTGEAFPDDATQEIGTAGGTLEELDPDELRALRDRMQAGPVLVSEAPADVGALVVVNMDGGTIVDVRANVPARVVILDDDTEGGDASQVIEVEGAERYVSTWAIGAETAAANAAGLADMARIAESL